MPSCTAYSSMTLMQMVLETKGFGHKDRHCLELPISIECSAWIEDISFLHFLFLWSLRTKELESSAAKTNKRCSVMDKW